MPVKKTVKVRAYDRKLPDGSITHVKAFNRIITGNESEVHHKWDIDKMLDEEKEREKEIVVFNCMFDYHDASDVEIYKKYSWIFSNVTDVRNVIETLIKKKYIKYEKRGSGFIITDEGKDELLDPTKSYYNI